MTLTMKFNRKVYVVPQEKYESLLSAANKDQDSKEDLTAPGVSAGGDSRAVSPADTHSSVVSPKDRENELHEQSHSKLFESKKGRAPLQNENKVVTSTEKKEDVATRRWDSAKVLSIIDTELTEESAQHNARAIFYMVSKPLQSQPSDPSDQPDPSDPPVPSESTESRHGSESELEYESELESDSETDSDVENSSLELNTNTSRVSRVSRGSRDSKISRANRANRTGSGAKENENKITNSHTNTRQRLLLQLVNGYDTEEYSNLLLHTQSSKFPVPPKAHKFYWLLLETSVPLKLISNSKLKRVLHFMINKYTTSTGTINIDSTVGEVKRRRQDQVGGSGGGKHSVHSGYSGHRGYRGHSVPRGHRGYSGLHEKKNAGKHPEKNKPKSKRSVGSGKISSSQQSRDNLQQQQQNQQHRQNQQQQRQKQKRDKKGPETKKLNRHKWISVSRS